jgi:hypothetical protein
MNLEVREAVTVDRRRDLKRYVRSNPFKVMLS